MPRPISADSDTGSAARRFVVALAALALPLAAAATYPTVKLTGSAGANVVHVTGRMASMQYSAHGLRVTLTDGWVVEIAHVSTLHYDGAQLTATYIVDPLFDDGFEATP